jgi:membrane associated rhomboid family serine protease
MIPLRDSIPSRTTPVITYGLIALNVLVFVYQLGMTEATEHDLFLELGLKPGYVSSYLAGDRAVVYPDERFVRTPFGQVFLTVVDRRVALDFWNSLFPFLSSMFLHGGLAHILGNMWFLHIFGDNVEDRLGHVRFLLFYLVTGIIASIVQILFSPSSMLPTIGASGAISGVLGAYLVTFPRSRVLSLVPIGFFFPLFFEIPAVAFLLVWFAIQFVSGVFSEPGEGGVAFWAHVGGFVAGMGAIKLVPPRPPPRGTWRDPREVPFELE